MGCRIVEVQYTSLETEYNNRSNAARSNPHPGFSSIVSINKMLYDTPGRVLLLVLMAVWMSAMR